jgi:O-antigen/teichoic acid export membrane protein
MRPDLRNLIALASIQASNALLPLVIFPYVLHIVGANAYSKIIIAESAIMVLLPIILYSFEIDGVAKAVAFKNQLNSEGLSQLVSSITCIRLAAFLLILLGMVAALLLFRVQDAFLYLAWLLLPLSHVFQSSWLFQGLERNIPLACFAVTSRGLAGVMIFLWVEEPADAPWVPIIVGGFYLMGGIACYIYIYSSMGLKFILVTLSDMRLLLLDGRRIFSGNASVVLYRDSNVLMLSAMGVTANGIAAYSISEKVVKCVQAAMRPLNQWYFPRAISIAQAAKSPSRSTLRNLWKVVVPQLLSLLLIVATFVSLYLGFAATLGVNRLLENQDRVLLLTTIMLIAVFFGISNFILGSAGLNYLGEQGYYMRTIFVSGVLSLFVCGLSVSALGEVGAAFAYVFAEALLFGLIIARYMSHKTDGRGASCQARAEYDSPK